MNTKLHIKLKKKSQPGYLIWFIIIMPFLFGFLIELIHIPSAVKYLLDVSWIMLVVYMIINHKLNIVKNTRAFFIWIISFLLFILVVYLFNYQSILYFLWGLRNNFRFYIAFLAFIIFLNTDDIEDYFNLFEKLYWVNIVVCLVQYFFLNLKGDYLGGLFGTESGCNGYINVFFVIAITKSIIYYLNKKENIVYCITKCAAALIVSSFAELKFFFVEFIVILIVSVLITDFSYRKALIIVCGFWGVSLSVNLLISLFPTFADIFTLQNLFEAASSSTGYTSSGDLNRLNSIQVISDNYLLTIPEKLFGMGLGNCDTASYDFLTTPFYNQHSWLHYHWLSTAFVFLETGYLGLMFFFGFFVLCFIKGMIKAKNCENKLYCHIACVMSVCCIIIAIYNSSLRTEAGYMAYFILALPYISEKAK